MKTIAVASLKGGSGKSTVCALIGERAAQEAGRVALLDMDEGQASLTEWWVQRGRPINPYLYNSAGTLDELVETLRVAGWDYCIIDCAPNNQDLTEMAILVSDLVIIPTKLAFWDASAIDPVVAMCRRRGKSFAFLVSEFDGRKSFKSANALALEMLAEQGGPILKSKISYDARHRIGQVKGTTGAGLSKDLAQEVDDVWRETKTLMGVTALRAVKGGRNG